MKAIHDCIKYNLSLIILFWIGSAEAQTVQWASRLIDFSSELTPLQYAARQILGRPDVLPSGGESPNAWAPSHANRREFIKVGYNDPMEIRQIAIAESYNPGAVFSVYIYDDNNKEYLVNTFDPQSIPLKGRMLNLFIEKTDFKVKAVKVELHGGIDPGYFSLDAIAISDSDIPIEAEINIAESINPDISKERLGSQINSEYKEYKPLLSPDGQTLYFSRQNHPGNMGGKRDYEDIWYAEMGPDGKWLAAKNIGEVLNNKKPNFASAVISDDEAWLMLLGNQYIRKNQMEAGVSISSNATGRWSKPQALEIKNGYNYAKRANYFMSNNRKVLLMALLREDSRGELDLYASFLQKDGSWSQPLNLSDNINTAGEEASPFLSPDNKTLYFSSNGYSGYGGSDIYYTVRMDSTWTNWSEPQNLGPAINSRYEDLFFNIPANSRFAYYCQGVKEGNVDIFRIKLPLTRPPEPVNAITAKLPGDQAHRLAGADFFGKKISNDLKKRRNNATLALNDVLFNFDSNMPAEGSAAALEHITRLLRDNDRLKIAIAGHTDGIGSAVYNLKLSEERARSVLNYFVNNGIKKERLRLVYFGETRPVAPNATREGRRKNRRVELKIIN